MARAPKANAERGEVDIVLEGVTYGLRPSYDALLAIEEATGQSIIEVARAAEVMALPIKHLAATVCELIRAFGRATDDRTIAAVNPKRIGELLIDEGLAKAYPRVSMVLFLAAMGGYTPAGEAKAAGMTTTGASTAA